MSCGMTSQTSKSFSSWPAVYRWRWRNEDLMWQCVADIDRHWFRRHCGQNAAACNFGFYSCIWVQLLFIVVPAVDCGGKTCELVWACLSFMTGLDGMCIFLSYIDLRYFFMQVFNDIHGHGHCSIFFLAKPYALRHLTPFSCHEFEVVSNWFLPVMSPENMSKRTELQAHNEMMSKFNQSPSNPTIPLAGWPWRIFYSDFSMV